MKKQWIFLAPMLFFTETKILQPLTIPTDIVFEEFKDNIGVKGTTETRQLFKTLNAYKNYFGHNPPPEVNFSSDWVFFYSAGIKKTTGYTASVSSISPNPGDHSLKITTSLGIPDSVCKTDIRSNIPYVLVRFQRPSPITETLHFYHNNKTINCKAGSFDEGNIKASDTAATGKWEIKSVKGIKKGWGRLDLNFPKGVYWSVDIYRGNKFIINRSIETYTLKYYELPPGLYNFKLNTVMIENIPIEAGKITTLKTGVLEINSNDWELRDESDKKFLTSDNRSRKLALPVGRYRLQEGKNRREIQISEITAQPNSQVLETDQWVSKPMETNQKINNRIGTGRLKLDFGSDVRLGLYGLHVYRQGGGFQTNINTDTDLRYLDLEPGFYRITWQGVGIVYENVNILKDFETTLKTGLYKVETECSWIIAMNMTSLSGQGPKTIAFPVGTGVTFYPPGNSSGYYTQFEYVIPGGIISSKVGYLEVTTNFSLQDIAGQSCIGYTGPRTVSLAPGKYKVQLPTGAVIVEIKPGETVTR